MKRFGVRRSRPYKNALISLVIFAAIVWVFIFAINRLSAVSANDQMEHLKAALNKGSLNYYSTYGTYPENLDELTDMYHITFDDERFSVFYQADGENMIPDITVVQKQ